MQIKQFLLFLAEASGPGECNAPQFICAILFQKPEGQPPGTPISRLVEVAVQSYRQEHGEDIVQWSDVLELVRTANAAAMLQYTFTGRKGPVPRQFQLIMTNGMESHVGWRGEDGSYVLLHENGQVGLLRPGSEFPSWN